MITALVTYNVAIVEANFDASFGVNCYFCLDSDFAFYSEMYSAEN